MIARLERSFAEIRRFTADASHELRTPLTALRTEVEVTLSKPLALEDAVQALGNVLEELVRMSRLTDQLLTLSRRDAGVEHLTLSSLDLHSLVAGVVDTMQPLAEAKVVELWLDGEGPAPVTGDESRLRQVFINLLDNAAKCPKWKGDRSDRTGGRGGQVTVEGWHQSAGHLPRVFDRFYRVDKSPRAVTRWTSTRMGMACPRSQIELGSILGVARSAIIAIGCGTSGSPSFADSRRVTVQEQNHDSAGSFVAVVE